MNTNIFIGLEANQKFREIITHHSDGDIPYPYFFGTSGYWQEFGIWAAYDNSDGNCWVEEFETEAAAKAWAECQDEDLWINQKLT